MLPTARASDWQTASAPARPPRLPPFGFELVTKKLMLGAGVALCCANAWLPIDNTAIVAVASNLVFMLGLLMGCSGFGLVYSITHHCRAITAFFYNPHRKHGFVRWYSTRITRDYGG